MVCNPVWSSRGRDDPDVRPVTVEPVSAGSGLAALLPELEWRGILHATTPGLPDRLATGRPISGYIGFDPSAPSLHVGHLVPIFGLLRLQRFGGRPVAVVGGGTGMIGDPSGRSSERNLLDRESLEANVASIRSQLERFLDFARRPSAARRGQQPRLARARSAFSNSCATWASTSRSRT